MSALGIDEGEEEAKNMTNTMHPEIEAFTTLWSTLRTTYEGTNITKTVARLLNMYQPHDGILAYERLLKTLFFLLEDLDKYSLHLLVSMIPPPTAVSSKLLNEVFYKATGFVRINAPMFSQNSNNIMTIDTLNLNIMDESRNSISQNVGNEMQTVQVIHENDSLNQHRKSPETLPRNTEVFRGFPPNEISTTRDQVDGTRSFCCSLANCCFPQSQVYLNTNENIQYTTTTTNHRQGPVTVPSLSCSQDPCLSNIRNFYQIAGSNENVFFQTESNKYIKLPVPKGNVSYIPDHSKAGALNAACKAEFLDIRLLKHQPVLRRQNVQENVQFESCMRISGDVQEKDILYDMQLHQLEGELQMKGISIERDIKRMDVVYWNEENHSTVVNNQDLKASNPVVDSLAVSEELKSSVHNFVKRAEEGVIIQTPAFPQTRSLFSCSEAIPSEHRKDLINSKEILKTEFVTNDDNVTTMGRQEQFHGTDAVCLEGGRKVTQRKRTESSRSSRSQNVKETKFQSQPFRTFRAIFNPHPTNVERTFACPADSCVTDSDPATKCFYDLDSKVDLRAYRKKYYDALLSIQGDKVAGNSSTVTSSRNITGCNTCYLNYLHDQQQQDFNLNPKLPPYDVHSRLSNLQNIPSPWSGTFKSSMVYSGNQSTNSEDVEATGYQCFPQTSQRTRP